MTWEPSIGKWNDDENYDLKEPTWQKLLHFASGQAEIRKLQDVLIWLNDRNMHDYYKKTLIIGCFLTKTGIDLHGQLGQESLAEITKLAASAETWEKCTVSLLKKEQIADEFICDFKDNFI
ncbi:MAG: hypothetical protein E7332_02735 [Clostridiales bacterium]|nr:hypothetical protein [Clostridiales bacterium]